MTATSNSFLSACYTIESEFSSMRHLPQYKLLARPVYKKVASYTNRAIGAAAAFFVTDIIMHQILPQALTCSLRRPPEIEDTSACRIKWLPGVTMFWMTFGAPVIIAKIHRDYFAGDRMWNHNVKLLENESHIPENHASPAA